MGNQPVMMLVKVLSRMARRVAGRHRVKGIPDLLIQMFYTKTIESDF